MGQALPELFTRRIALDDVGSHADASGLDQEDVLDLEAVYLLEDASVSEGRIVERTEGCLAFEAAGLEAWTPYHGKRGGKGWQKDGQGKPRYQEEKPRDDEAPIGKPDMPVVKIDAPGSRQPALFDKLDGGGTPGESKPVAEKPPDAANIPSAPANKQVEAEPDVKPMEVKTMKRVAKTKSGLEVELEATTDGVSFSVDHPQAGRLTGKLDYWDEDKAIAYTDQRYKGGRVGLSISKSDYDAAMSDKNAAKELELDDIRTGKTPIKVSYRDGEYLSGYWVFGPAADMLVQLGVAKDVNGWGTEVERVLVDRYGKEFTYQQAEEYARPRLEAQAEAKAKAESERAAIFDEAKQTGKPVKLRSWSETRVTRDEGEPGEYLFIITEYANPDGTVSRKEINTY